MRPIRGIVTIVVPTPLLLNSVAEWYEQIDMLENPLGLQFHVQTTRAPSKKPDLVEVQIGETRQRMNIIDILITPEKIKGLVDSAGKKNQLKGMLRNLFLTRPTAYNNFMDSVKFPIHDLPCGRFIRDEFHQEPAMDKNLMCKARELILNR